MTMRARRHIGFPALLAAVLLLAGAAVTFPAKAQDGTQGQQAAQAQEGTQGQGATQGREATQGRGATQGQEGTQGQQGISARPDVPAQQVNLTAHEGRMDAEAATRAFKEANTLYSQERYVEAAALYQKIVDSGFAGADVLYNLGNAHYKAGDLGQAVLSYERALRVRPSHEDARQNLQFVSELLADRRTPVGGAVSDLLGRVFERLTLDRLAGMTSILYFVLFALLTAAVLLFGFSGWQSGWLGRVAIVLVLCVGVVGGTLAFRLAVVRGDVQAIVMAKEVGVRTGPGEDFVLEFRLHEGTKVKVEESRDNWVRVSVPGTDLSGWMPDGSMERI